MNIKQGVKWRAYYSHNYMPDKRLSLSREKSVLLIIQKRGEDLPLPQYFTLMHHNRFQESMMPSFKTYIFADLLFSFFSASTLTASQSHSLPVSSCLPNLSKNCVISAICVTHFQRPSAKTPKNMPKPPLLCRKALTNLPFSKYGSKKINT